MSDKRRDAIVVAVTNLVAGNGVIFVHDRNATKFEQTNQRVSGVQILMTVGKVVGHQQHLRSNDTMTSELLVVLLHQPWLASSSKGLQRQHIGWP